MHLLVLVVGRVMRRLLEARGLKSMLDRLSGMLGVMLMCGLKKLWPWQVLVGTRFTVVTLWVWVTMGMLGVWILSAMLSVLVTL